VICICPGCIGYCCSILASLLKGDKVQGVHQTGMQDHIWDLSHHLCTYKLTRGKGKYSTQTLKKRASNIESSTGADIYDILLETKSKAKQFCIASYEKHTWNWNK